MSEYRHVEKQFLDQLAALGWDVIDQGQGYPADPARSQRGSFREWFLPEVFRAAVRFTGPTPIGMRPQTRKNTYICLRRGKER